MYGDNLPPGCTVRDIERQCEDDDDMYDDDRPDMDPDLWDDRDINAADDAATALAMRLMREMMGLPALPTDGRSN
jgi:hypothetical protein